MRPTPLPLLALALLLAQCKASAPNPAPVTPVDPLSQLPPPTQTGARTFGCLVNGQAWAPAGNPFGGPLFTAQYFQKRLSLAANRGFISNKKTTSDLIQINIEGVSLPGRYNLSRPDTSFVNYNDLIAKCSYYTDSVHPATVIITKLDVVNRIVSGTFAFTLETPGCGKVVVTDGRFDSRY